MKTKEELLKIYSAYLPYELNLAVMGEFVDEERKIPQIFEMIGLNTNYVEYHELGRTVTEQTEFTDVFPHLWSMDMLTKEIEHKGERFIPIERLFDIETGLNWSNSDYIKSDSGKDEYWVRSKEEGMSFYFGYNCENNYFYHIAGDGFKKSVKNQLEMFQKLFEWHFNVFGLDESEYIKKENI